MAKLLLCLASLLAILINAKSQPPFLLKSARIEFVFSSGMQMGTKTLIFKDSGINARQESFTYADTSLLSSMLPDTLHQFFKQIAKSHVLLIETRDSIFQIDLNTSTGTAIQRFYLTGDSGIPMGSKKIGADTFLGRMCEVFDFNGFKLWYWKGLVLKKEYITKEGGRIYDYATSIDENYVEEKDTFEIPKGVKMKY
jgi:hypothetical protein